MEATAHLSFDNAFARELGLTEVAGATPSGATPALEFNPGEPERLAEQFDFPPELKAGLVETAVSEGRRVLRFHGEIAAGLDLDHHSAPDAAVAPDHGAMRCRAAAPPVRRAGSMR